MFYLIWSPIVVVVDVNQGRKKKKTLSPDIRLTFLTPGAHTVFHIYSDWLVVGVGLGLIGSGLGFCLLTCVRLAHSVCQTFSRVRSELPSKTIPLSYIQFQLPTNWFRQTRVRFSNKWEQHYLLALPLYKLGSSANPLIYHR